MEILQENLDSKGVFYIKNESGRRVGEMTYSWAGDDRIIIDHTEIADELRGKGAGKQLVKAAVDFVRIKKISIIPLCPFAKAVFNKEADWKDVL